MDNEKSDDDCPVVRFTHCLVSDKLLWLESTDIDVGMNNITGYDFATRLFHFSKVNLDQYGLEPGEVTKIESNPENSNDLQSARMQIGGLDMDFINQRIAADSGYGRIPHMVFPAVQSTFFSAADLDSIALGIRNARTRCHPLRLDHQRPLLQATQ